MSVKTKTRTGKKGRRKVTYHSFLTIGLVQGICLFVRGVLNPMDARVKVRTRAVRLTPFMFAGFRSISKLRELFIRCRAPLLYMKDPPEKKTR